MLENIVVLFFFVWLSVLSFISVRIFIFFNKLSKEVKAGELVEVITKLINLEKSNSASSKKFERELSILEKDAKTHLQRIGLVKYNPFNEMGGDNSFCLALLNDNLDGVLITCLHTRQRTRFYIKSIKNGQSGVNLSQEESSALENAK